MLLITSIPPRFSRIEQASGREIGQQYLAECVSSWRRNGFEPLSLNRPDEVEAVRSLNLMEVAVAAPDESRDPMRFGPSLGAVFDVAPKNRPVAIVNADIYMLAMEAKLASAMADLVETSVVVGRRTDVTRFGDLIGSTFAYGFDFFAFHPSKVSRALDDQALRRFQLGAPWWDYVFPLVCSRDVPIKRIKEPFIAHLAHNERWDPPMFNALALDACRALIAVEPMTFGPVLEILPYSSIPGETVARLCHARLLGKAVEETPLGSIHKDPCFPGSIELRATLEPPKAKPQTNGWKEPTPSRPQRVRHLPRDVIRFLRRKLGAF